MIGIQLKIDIPLTCEVTSSKKKKKRKCNSIETCSVRTKKNIMSVKADICYVISASVVVDV